MSQPGEMMAKAVPTTMPTAACGQLDAPQEQERRGEHEAQENRERQEQDVAPK
jgi:hypothetical protein